MEPDVNDKDMNKKMKSGMMKNKQYVQPCVMKKQDVQKKESIIMKYFNLKGFKLQHEKMISSSSFRISSFKTDI
jgi:hypothetical protein